MNGLLQTTDCNTYKIKWDRKVQDIVYKIWLSNTDKYGTLTHTLRTMHRVPARPVETMGYSLHARGKTPREKLIHNINLRREKYAIRQESQIIGLAKIYEAVEKICNEKRNGENQILPLWGIRT